MKKAKSENNNAKILTTTISALMLISLISVFQAGTASANLGDSISAVEFEAGGGGTAEWTTEEHYSGDYSVKLVMPDAEAYAEIAIPVENERLQSSLYISHCRLGVRTNGSDQWFANYLTGTPYLHNDKMEEAKVRKSGLEARRILLHDRRITIPKDFRDFLRLKEGSVFEIGVEDGRLTLQLIKR
ncbi:unnamed protein product [marine sediment metagenome]|uniref:SpoVT-AbrB domain-containing protein n=2 Tax=marine sediment metagenome TaxID=412755 RepID=X1MWD4_9ZZZZ